MTTDVWFMTLLMEIWLVSELRCFIFSPIIYYKYILRFARARYSYCLRKNVVEVILFLNLIKKKIFYLIITQLQFKQILLVVCTCGITYLVILGIFLWKLRFYFFKKRSFNLKLKRLVLPDDLITVEANVTEWLKDLETYQLCNNVLGYVQFILNFQVFLRNQAEYRTNLILMNVLTMQQHS